MPALNTSDIQPAAHIFDRSDLESVLANPDVQGLKVSPANINGTPTLIYEGISATGETVTSVYGGPPPCPPWCS